MAAISAIIAAISRRLAAILRAILGWSVTALFGRLSNVKQTALSAVIVLSIIWPILVAGIFSPGVAAWAVAFLPIHKWVPDNILRFVWLGLALLLPIGVGALTGWIAGSSQKQTSKLRQLFGGYPLTLGYATSFLLTAMVVPAIKIATIVRRWTDQHIYVQPAPGEMERVAATLTLAVKQAGFEAARLPMPKMLAAPTKLLKWFARGALDAIVTDDPVRLRGAEIELYQYPADLLIRGPLMKVNKIRAAITRTNIDRFAYVVQDGGAQKIQEQIRRLDEVVARHDLQHEHPGKLFDVRLKEIEGTLEKADIPHEEWIILDRLVHRLDVTASGAERHVLRGPPEKEPNMQPMREIRTINRVEPYPADATTTELVKRAVDDAKDLMMAELALAKQELKDEVKGAKKGGILLGAGIVFGIATVTLLLMTLVVAIDLTVPSIAIVSGIVGAIAGILGFLGYKKLPTKPLARTRARLEQDIQQVKERLA